MKPSLEVHADAVLPDEEIIRPHGIAHRRIRPCDVGRTSEDEFRLVTYTARKRSANGTRNITGQVSLVATTAIASDTPASA